MSFSIPIFPGGIGALVRADAPFRLREVLAGHGEVFRPTWRASATQLLQTRAFSVVSGTTAERWLNERFSDLKIVADISRTDSYDTAIRALLDRRTDVVVGERAILLDAAQRHASARDLMMIDRLFTYEPLALVLRRDDEPFRLAVDRLLSRQIPRRALRRPLHEVVRRARRGDDDVLPLERPAGIAERVAADIKEFMT